MKYASIGHRLIIEKTSGGELDDLWFGVVISGPDYALNKKVVWDRRAHWPLPSDSTGKDKFAVGEESVIAGVVD